MQDSAKEKLIQVGVVLAREDIDHAWESHRWRPSEIVLGVAGRNIGDVIDQGDGFVRFFAGTAELELHHKETEAYAVNLQNDVPVVYVVACPSEDEDAPLPFEVRLVTVSPFKAQDFLDTGEDIVEALPMNPTLLAWVNAFVESHHVEEKFIKRRRDRVDLKQEKFGQEPIAILRARTKRRYDA